MSNVWLTSDTHFSHQFVAETRGFDSNAEHDEWVVETWNEHVKPSDVVWHLGDVSISRAPSRYQPWVRALNGKKHLVSGNHDGSFVGRRQAYQDHKNYLEVFETVQSMARRKYSGIEFFLNHFPYSGDTEGRDEDRYRQYRLPDYGTPIVHGHTHSSLVYNTSLAGTPQIHVGWDAWHRPVNQDEVGVILSGFNRD